MTSTTRTRSKTPRASATAPEPIPVIGTTTPRRAPRGPRIAPLDNLTLSRKEGFRAAVDAPPRPQPERLINGQLQNLTEAARREYNRRRNVWHANLPTIKTTPLLELHEQLEDLVGSNQHDGDKAKGAIAVEGPAGIGKSVAVMDFAKAFHRQTIADLGEFTEAGHERWPVCRVGLNGDTTIKDFNRALLSFYAHAGIRKGTAPEFADRALDCVISCSTRLLIVDDVHFLKQRATSIQISNQFKYIANEFPLTILFVGIDLKSRGLYSDGTPAAGILGQSARRITPLAFRSFSVYDEAHRREWRQLLLRLEQQIVLAGNHRGMLVDLSDHLWARSSGHIGSLTALITRACHRAIRTGRECIDLTLLQHIPLDVAAAAELPGLRAQLEHAHRSTRPRRDHPRTPGRQPKARPPHSQTDAKQRAIASPATS